MMTTIPSARLVDRYPNDTHDDAGGAPLVEEFLAESVVVAVLPALLVVSVVVGEDGVWVDPEDGAAAGAEDAGVGVVPAGAEDTVVGVAPVEVEDAVSDVEPADAVVVGATVDPGRLEGSIVNPGGMVVTVPEVVVDPDVGLIVAIPGPKVLDGTVMVPAVGEAVAVPLPSLLLPKSVVDDEEPAGARPLTVNVMLSAESEVTAIVIPVD
jgi:hypothetical protein